VSYCAHAIFRSFVLSFDPEALQASLERALSPRRDYSILQTARAKNMWTPWYFGKSFKWTMTERGVGHGGIGFRKAGKAGRA
jgi:hypothetical protein